MCLPTCEEGGCIHYLNSISICPDHQKHSYRVLEFHDDAPALQEALMENSVKSISVCYNDTKPCQWDGMCSLTYISHTGENILVKDDLDHTFYVHISQVASFEDTRLIQAESESQNYMDFNESVEQFDQYGHEIDEYVQEIEENLHNY